MQQLGNVDAYNFARKPAYDFGWDWGPGFGASGVHGRVGLLGYDSAVLRSALVRQAFGGSKFTVSVEAQLLVPAGGDVGRLTAKMPALGIEQSRVVSFPSGSDGLATVKFDVPADKVQLWYPVGYGKQPLYDLQLTYVPVDAAVARTEGKEDTKQGSTASALKANALNKKSKAAGSAACRPEDSCSSVLKRVGFRVSELVRDPIDKAAADLLGKAKGWDNTLPLNVEGGWGYRSEGIWGWVNETKWEFVSRSLTPKSPAPYVTGYPFGPHPGGENPWWNDNMGIYTGRSGDPSRLKWIEGESFYFRVNGVPVYAKGANIIPFSILPTNATREVVYKTLRGALDANMNMLRVWGGGWYMPDYFYDICDELGIMVWQETMFACAPYPR